MQNRFWYLLSKKLSGIATDAELDELDHLLAENPEWNATTDQLSAYWETAYEPAYHEANYDKHIKRMERLGYDTSFFLAATEQEQAPVINMPGKRKWWWAAGVAASILTLFLIAFLFTQKTAINAIEGNHAVVNEVVTDKGKKSKIVLPDGSQVWLNADSKLEYKSSFGKSDRNVVLSGEAYFDVVKNVSMPFIIQTRQIMIKVTGTAFNVKAYPGESLSEASLIRGKIEVTVNKRPDEKYILTPNEKIVVRDDALNDGAGKNNALTSERKNTNLPLIQVGYVNYLENDSLAVETSWMYNRLIFEDESFEEIASKMERWYGVSINITDRKVAATRFSYQIRNETIMQALSNMQYAARFHFTSNGNTVTITK